MICPLLSFDVADVDFGCVALGFSVTKEIHLINTSTVAINYKVEVSGDGQHPAIKCEDLNRLPDKVHSLCNIKELEFYPKRGVAEPKETIALKVKKKNVLSAALCQFFICAVADYAYSECNTD